MSTEKTNDRNASTEQLFDSEQLKKTRLRDEDDNIAPAGSGEEELSLQNIFIDKGEDVVSDASGMVTAAGSIPAINTSAQISANADSKVADQAVDRTPPVHSEESTQDSPDKPESVLSAQAELGSPIVLTASDVLPALGYSNGNVVEITSLTVSQESGTIVDNGDGTWTLHTYDNQVGEVLALQANVSEGGNTTSVEGLIEVPADARMDDPHPIAENTHDSSPGDSFEIAQDSSTQPIDTSINGDVPEQPDTTADNQRPIVANVDLGSTLEDTSTTFRLEDLLQGTLDPDGDTLTVTDIRVDPALGSITINGDGSFTFEPAANYNGEGLPLTFTVSDGEHSVESNASLNVLAVNDDPVAGMVDLASINEDSSLTFGADDLLAGASDIDGDDLKVTSVTVDEKLGTVSDNGDGTFTFKPTENFNGEDVPLSFTVSDGVAEVQSTALIDVAAVNDGPIAEKIDLGAMKEDSSITFKADQLLAGASDIDGDDLKVTSVTVDEKLGSVSDNGDGTYTFKPTENFNGDDVPLSFTVSDGTAEVESVATIDVAAVNDGPVAEKIDLGSIKEDTSITFKADELLAGASDIDGDDLKVTSVTVDEKLGSVADNGDGTFTFKPTENFNGEDIPLSFTVSDGTAEVESVATIDVAAVNDGPVAEKVDLGSIKEDTSITFKADELLAGASDIDGDDLKVTSVKVDEKLGSVADNGDGTYTFKPTENFNGDDVPLSFTVSDGTAEVESTAFIDVAAVNDGPIAEKIDLGAMKEDSSITFKADQLLAGASDIDGDDLKVTSVTVDEKLGTVSDNGDGTYTFKPTENFNDDDVPLSFTVSDGTAEVESVATIDVAAVNDGPIAEKIDLGAMKEDSSITFKADQLLAGASDIDGDDLKVTSVTVDEKLGSVADNGDGTFTFKPTENFNGDEVPLSFTVSDDVAEVESTAFIDVAAVNDGPVAEKVDLGSIKEDTSITFKADELLAGASDIDGDDLKVTSVKVDEKLATVSDNGDGTFTFKPTENFNGDDVPLSFTVSDGTAEVESVATIDVAAVNDGPVAEKVDLGSIKEDTSITFKADELLAGASDIDGDDLKVTSVKVDEKLGSVADNGDGTFTFKPTENFNGEDIPLSFTVSDGTAEVESVATIDVAAVNDGPVAEKVDLGSIKEDTSITFKADELLAGASDIDGDDLKVTSVKVDEKLGSVSDNGDGTFTFKPTENFNGEDIPLSFTVSDGVAEVESTAFIDVAAVNDGPVAEKVDLGTIREDSSITFKADQLLAGASDIDGDDLKVTSVTVDEKLGSVSDNGDGTYTFKPTENFNGDDVPLSFTVSDGTAEVESVATIDVAAVNDGPVAEKIDLGSIKEDTSITFKADELLAGASDIDGDDLKVTSVKVDEKLGSVSDNGDGTYTFKPTENFNGDDVPLNFTVSDGTAEVESVATLDIIDQPDDVSLRGTNRADILKGGDGNDTIEGRRGDDFLSGGAGDDTFKVRGNAGYDKVDGGEGHDTIEGSRHNDTIQVGDNLENIQNVETIDGGKGYDTLQAGSGDDTLDLSKGPELKNIEEIDGGRGNDTIIGTRGDDTIEGNLGDDKLIGGEGNDTFKVRGNAGYDKVDGGEGHDTIEGSRHNDTIQVGDNLENIQNVETIDGGKGYDTLQAGSGDDTLDLSKGPELKNIEEIDGGRGNDTIIGTRGDDTIEGNLGDDKLIGGEGNDTFKVRGNAGYDKVDGGEGHDTIEGSRHNDTIQVGDNLENIQNVETIDGGKGYDTLQAGSGDDTLDLSKGPELKNIEEIDGGRGNDTIIGTRGDDTIEGNLGDDKLIGGEGNDTFKVRGNAGYDTVDGGEGHDTIEGSRYNDTIQVGDNLENIQNVETIDGGKGYDTLQAGSGDDTLDLSKGPELKNIEEIDGGRGNDTIIGTRGDDTIEGNLGDDKLIGGEGNDTFKVRGNAGYDKVDGGEGHDTIEGSRYNDTIQVGDNLENIQNVETIDGGKGYDTLQAGSGDDTLDLSKGPELKNIEEIDGGRGNDTIIGTRGDDTIEGNLGDDKLIGGEGNDTFKVRGNAGYDTVDGGEGHDTIEGSRYNDTIQVGDNLENIQNVETIDGGKGYDTLQAGSGDDTLDLSKGPELKNIEEIDGGRGNDTIIGTRGDDKLDGNHGDDKLIGGEGNDSLIGARGNDTLVGGAGDDSIDGGHGSDTLVLQGDWQDYTVTQNDDSSFTITDSVAGRDGTDTFQGIESLQFADQTLSVDKITQAESSDTAQAPQESAEDMLFLMDMESPEMAEGGWIEDIDAEQLDAGFASADGWEDGETGNSDEMDTAANALDLAPDTTGVINFTEGTDADGLAGLQEAGLL